MPYDRLLRHRSSEPGASYHLSFCTVDRQPLLTQPEAARIAKAAIEEQAARGHCINHTWVLMPDHVHWLLSLTEASCLPFVVAACKANSARAMKGIGLVDGSPWQPKYYEHKIRADEDLQQQARYLIANPLRAGLVSRLADYPWWWAQWAGAPHGPMNAGAAGEDLLW
jgi:REP element-mobilizing transposase RayT